MLRLRGGAAFDESSEQFAARHAVEDVVVRRDRHFGVADVLARECGGEAENERMDVMAVFEHRLHGPVDLEEMVEIAE